MKSTWTTYHVKRGYGERVRDSSEAMLEATDGGGGRRRRNMVIQQTAETGGAGRVTVLTISNRV